LLSAITEFPLHPADINPGSLTVGPDGNLWFPESSDSSPDHGAIGRITPSGAITQFPLPTPDGGPGPLTVGPDGNLWFDEGFPAILPGVLPPDRIGRITPAGAITEFPLPTDYTIVAYNPALTVGPDGNLWFTDLSESSPEPFAIGRITPAGAITEFPVGTSGAGPVGAPTVGPDGNLWFTAESSSGPAIGRITPAGAITEFPLPTPDGVPGPLTVGPDGNLWFPVDGASGSTIGRITPAGAITEFPLPTAGIQPDSLTVGRDGNLWFTEYSEPSTIGPGDYPSFNTVGRITPAGTITQFRLHKVGISEGASALTVDPHGKLWFTLSNLAWGEIVRITPSGAVTKFRLPRSLGSPGELTVGRDGNLWFPNWVGRIGRVDLTPRAKRVKVAGASYDRAAHAVRLKLAVPQKGPVQVTVRAGLMAADRMSSSSDFTAVVK
jgi:streptogramin lyase